MSIVQGRKGVKVKLQSLQVKNEYLYILFNFPVIVSHCNGPFSRLLSPSTTQDLRRYHASL